MLRVVLTRRVLSREVLGHPVDGSTEVFHRNMDTRRATCADLGIPLKTWVFLGKLTLFASDPSFVEHDIGPLCLRHYPRPDHADMGLHYLQDVINDPTDFPQTDTHLSAKDMCKAVAAMAAALDLPGREAFVAQAAATWFADDALCGGPARCDPLGMAERLLSHVLDDAARPLILSFPYVRGCAMTPSAGFAALWSEMIDAHLLR